MNLIFSNETSEDLSNLIPEIENALKTGLKLEGMSEDFEVSLTVTDNEKIRELNKDYRGVDRETDVLSFPLWNGEFSNDNLLGDIVISAEKAREQSEEYGHSFEREVIYLTIHSLLHLLGYDHMEDEDKALMREHEKSIMKELKLFK